MNNKKENMMVVRFRATDEEKEAIEKAAKEYAISVNQYVKHKVLAALEDEYFHNSSTNNRQSSPKHWRLLSRIII